MKYLWHDIVGGAGVITLLLTYLLLQINYLSARSLRYSVLNGLGAGLILVSLWFNFNLSAFIIEASWLVISCIGAIVSLLEMRKRKPTNS
jgi:hypothetical protein